MGLWKGERFRTGFTEVEQSGAAEEKQEFLARKSGQKNIGVIKYSSALRHCTELSKCRTRGGWIK